MSLEGKTFNLSEAADELIASDNEAAAASTQETQLEGQSATNPEKTEGENSLSPQEILKQIASEKPQELNQEILEKLNSLGLIHNGSPFKVESTEQMKELLQKGFDYSKKTMSHADEVKLQKDEFTKLDNTYKEREAAFVQKEQALANISHENKIMENLLMSWKEHDPELFEHIQKAYHGEVNAFNKQQPMIEKYENRFKEYDNRFAELAKGNQQAELSNIKSGWEKDLNDVQTRQSAALAKLGVSPDWDKVKATWTADSTNKLSVEDALYAVHGKDIAKANESYSKLLATRNKTQSQILGRSGMGQGHKGSEAIKNNNNGPGYAGLLRNLLNETN